MWYLLIYDSNGVEVARIPILENAVVSIGSDPSNTTQLPLASPAQAFVYITGGYPVIEDAGTQSTLLDGFALTAPAYLTPESQVFFGSAYVAYVYFDTTAVPPPPDVVPPPPPDYVDIQENAGQILIHPEEHDVQPPIPTASVQVGYDALVESKKQLKLVAREGYLDGREFILAYDDFFDLGRAPNVEIVVDDPSVSRVHARLLVEPGGTLLVQDLRSTNGTFINGQEIVREHAHVGDRIRFGEVPFWLTEVGTGSQKGGSFRFQQYKKLIFTFVGIVFLFGVIAVIQVAKSHRFKPPEDTRAREVSYDENIKARVARLKVEADEMARLDDWDGAVAKYREALGLLPDDTEVKEKLSDAQYEKRNYAIFKEALELKNRMTHEARIKALEKFGQIDKKSQYYRTDISPIIVELKQDLARHYKAEGIALLKSQQYQQAAENFCQYFELDSKLDDLKGEEQVRLDLQYCEKMLAGRKDYTPCEAIRFHERRIPVDEIWAKQAKEAIFKKYPAGIAEQVFMYFVGDPKNAILGLEELLKNPKNKKKFTEHAQMIVDLQSQLRNVVQGYESGETKLQSGDIESARNDWNVVLTVDRMIIPKEFKSKYYRNISNRLAKSYYNDGRKSMELYRYEEAFDYFKKGLDLDPDDTTELLDGFKELEQKAIELFDEAISLYDSGNKAQAEKLLTRVVKMTLEKSPTHQKAKNYLK